MVLRASTPTRVDPAWIDETTRTSMELDRVPGLAVALIEDGELVHSGGFGVTCLDEEPAVSGETVFRVGSVTKPLTATLVMRLVELGMVDLDRPVGDMVPWLRLDDGVTLRRLLSHTSGLPTEVIAADDPGLLHDSGIEEYVRRRLPELRPVARPGERTHYSNPAYTLAGFVAQHVAGVGFEELLARVVLEPLGMSSTTFRPAAGSVAREHELTPEGVRSVPHTPVRAAHAPAGLAFSTALDLAAFARMHLDAGGDLLSAETVSEMHALASNREPGRDGGFGLGFQVYTARNGRDTVVHPGSVGGFWAILAMVPSSRAAAIVLTNRIPGFRLPSLAYRLLDEMLGLPSPWAGMTRADWPKRADWNLAG